VYPYCEPAEIEPFEDFTEAVEELLTEESISVVSNNNTITVLEHDANGMAT